MSLQRRNGGVLFPCQHLKSSCKATHDQMLREWNLNLKWNDHKRSCLSPSWCSWHRSCQLACNSQSCQTFKAAPATNSCTDCTTASLVAEVALSWALDSRSAAASVSVRLMLSAKSRTPSRPSSKRGPFISAYKQKLRVHTAVYSSAACMLVLLCLMGCDHQSCF